MRILIVEDDKILRDGVADLLRGAGYSVEPVADGAEGLRRAIAESFDIVLLDLALPGLDGIEVCQRLRVTRPAVPILMLTARGSEEDKVRGLKVGADDYVTKPFGARELLARVEARGQSSSNGISSEENLPAVSFDRDALHHIVQNLVDNAERYSRASQERTIEIAVTKMNGSAAVIVSDRGVGIDAKVARHLFVPFERGARQGAPAGLGLGLVLVKAHGGEVSWSSRLGGGTTFSVILKAES